MESHHRGLRSCWGTWTWEHAGGRSVANRALPGLLCFCLASPDMLLVKDEDVCSSPHCSWVRVDVFICTPHFQKSEGKSFCHCWHQNSFRLICPFWCVCHLVNLLFWVQVLPNYGYQENLYKKLWGSVSLWLFQHMTSCWSVNLGSCAVLHSGNRLHTHTVLSH